MTNIKDIKQSLISKLPIKEIDLLLSFALKKDKSYILAHPEKKINLIQQIKINYFAHQRMHNTPLAYIFKKKEFYGLNFLLNKNVLIPRPETEEMVDDIIQLSEQIQNPAIVDLGTGSGCIILSLNKELGNKVKTYFAGDISSKALSVAQKNAKQLKVKPKIHFIKSDLMEKIYPLIKKEKNIIISANLPYLSFEQLKKLPQIKKEPRLALEAGKDGLKYYKKLFSQIKKYSNKKQNFYIFCEIDPGQTFKIQKIAEKTFDNNIKQKQIKKDLRGLERFFILYLMF